MPKKITPSGILIIVSGIVIMALLILGDSMPENVYTPYTTHSAQPNGTKAIMLLLKQEGVPVAELLTAAPEKEGLMILVKPAEQSLQDQDWQQMLAWVEKGNTLLLASNNEKDLYEKFGYKVTKTNNAKDGLISSDNPLLADVGQLALTGKTRLKKDNSMLFAYGDDDGVYLAESAKGKGRVIFLTDPEILTNQQIKQKDNLILFLNIVRLYGQKGIWFNEYSHGYTLPKASRNMFTWPFRLVTIQLALGVLLLFYYWGKRFGRPIPLPPKVGRISGNYVSSMANIYRQGQARKLILENIYEDFKKNAARYLGVSPQISNAELVKVFSGRPQLDTLKLENLLRRCTELLKNPAFSENALFTTARELEEWQQNNLNSYLKRGKQHDR